MKLINDNKDKEKDPISSLIEALQSDKDNGLTMMDYTPGSDRLLKDINTFTRSSSEIDPELYRKYKRYGIEFDPAKYRAGILDKELADAQSNWEKIRNALDQTVVNEIGLGTLTGFADLYDIILGRAFNHNEDYQNPVSVYLENLQEQFKQSHDIYQDPTKTGWKDWSDFGWWMNNVPSIMSSLTLLIPGAGVGKGVSFVGRGISRGVRKGVAYTRKAARGVENANKAQKVSRLGKAYDALNTASRRTAVNRFLENGSTALAMRMMENYQESRQVYNDMMDQVEDTLGNMSPEEREDLIERNKDILNEYQADVNDNKSIAQAISKASADETFRIDMNNLIFDVIQVSALRNPLKLPKNLRKTAAVNKAQREAKIFTKHGTVEGAKILENRSAKEKAFDWISDRVHAKNIVAAELSEGVEEAVNYVAQQEGMHYGNVMLDPKTYNQTLSDGWNDYLTNSELYESAFWGVLGGVMFEGGGSAVKRAFNAGITTAKTNKKANDITHEGPEKTTFRQEFQTSENKLRTAEIDKRYTNLEILKGRRDKIYNEHKSPFDTDKDPITGEELSLDTQVERDAAWQRAVDDFIVNQTFLAIDAGNFDLLKEYLRDPGVREVIENIGNDPNNPTPKIDVEDLIKRMDEVEEKYNNNLIVVNSFTGDLADELGDTPLEYVNIIARNNTMAEVKADRIDAKIKGYEASAEANKFRFGESLKEYFGDATLDYKTAVSLITTVNFIKDLRAQKKQILDDKNKAGSVDGQLMIKELDSRIKTLSNYVKSIQPAIVGYEQNAKLFNVINSLFANQQSLDSESVEYTDFLAAMAGRDIEKLNELTGENFKLTDEEIIKVFGEPGTATGAYYQLSNELIKHFGVSKKNGTTVPKFVELAPNLSDDYTTIAALNASKLIEQSKIAVTRETIKDKVKALHNSLNQARVAAINKARDIIVKNAKQYGRDKMLDYVFDNVPIDQMSSSDKKDVDDALQVLNLSNPLNKDVYEMIYKNILLGGYEASVDEAKQRKNSSTNENLDTSGKESNLNNPSLEGQKANSGQESGQSGQKPTQKPTQQAPTPQPANSTPTTEPTPETNPKYRIEIKSDIDKGLDFSFTTSKESKGVPYIEGDNNTFELQIDSTEISDEERDRLVSLSDLFDGYDANNKDKYRIVKNPVLTRLDEYGNTTLDKGQIEYISETSDNSVPTSTIPSTGEEDEGNNTDFDLSEDEAAREEEKRKHNERELQVRRELFVKMLAVVKPMVDSGKSQEEINAAIDNVVEKYKQETEDSSEFEQGIQATIEAVKKQYDLLGVATAAENVIAFKTESELRSSTVVESNPKLVKENGKYTEAFINQVYNLVQEYTKAANIRQGANGKYYINFEDFLRNLNNIYPGMYEGDQVYSKLKDFFASNYNTQVIITDNLNDPDILENAKKTVEQRLKEKIGNRSNYRVGIDELFERGGETFVTAFNDLKVGDKLQTGRDVFGRLTVIHNGVVVGIMAIPDPINHNTGYQVINKGWITDVYSNPSLSKLRDHLTRLAYDDSLNDMINSYLYDKLTDDKKTNLVFDIYNYLKNTSNSFLNEKNASPKDIVDWISNIWRYRMNADDFSKPAGDRSIRINSFIDRFFEKLYDSYDIVNKLTTSEGKNVDVEVAYINDGELIRAVDDSQIDLSVPRQSRNNYYQFTTSDKAFANPASVKVGAVIENGVLGLGKNETIEHDKLGTNGTIHTVIPNRSGKPQFAIATSVTTNDEQLDHSSDAYKIIEESKAYIKRALDEFLSNPSEENYKNLSTVLSDLFEHDAGHASIFACVGISFDANGNVTLKTGNRYLKIYKKGSKDNVDFIYNDGKENSKARPYKYESNEDILRTAIDNIFNRAFFNVDFKFINDGWNENNGAIGYTNDGRQFVIKVNGKVFRYKDMSEAFIKGGLLRVNTKVEDNSNYRRKGENQGGNQILEVSFVTKTTTPVEKSGENPTAPTSTQEEVSGSDILNNEDANTAVDKLVTTALPDLKKNDKKTLKDLGLLPKSIIFAEELKDNDGKPAVAQVNTSTREVKVSQLWVDMYDGNGEYSDDRDFYRKQAIRKLIHEQLHVRIAEQGKEEVLNQIRNIYNEFKSFVNSLSEEEQKVYSPYLFDNKKNEDEKLEEFLVESFTSKTLTEKLNEIEATYEEGELNTEKAKETLWDKILKLIAKIFNYSFTKTDKAGRTIVNIDKKSLLQKELYALAGALNTKAETNIEGTPVQITSGEETESEELLDDDTPFETIDGNEMHSTVVEKSNVTMSSPNVLITSLNSDIQSEAARMVENGELTTICK